MMFGWNLNGVTPNRGTNCRWGRWKLETFDKQLTIFCTRYNVDKWFLLKLIHTSLQDTTKLSCLCYVRFGGMNWIPNNSRLSPIELEVWTRSEQSSNSRRHTRHNTDRTILSCLVWRCELSRPDRRQVCSALKCDGQRSVSTGHTHTPTQNALFWRSSRTRHDKTLTLACRPPPRPRPGRQLCLAACWQTAHKQRRCKPRSFL